MRYLALLFALIYFISASAQTILDGVVLDKDKQPIARAIVKVMDGEKTLAFTTAKPDGSFVLAFTSDADSLTISAEKMSYTKEIRKIANPLLSKNGGKQTVRFVLQDSFTQLKEVVVKAPAIVQVGDTLRFNLSAFLGKGDVSLEDALKKLPGITIDEGGTIKYQGKAISNFYVEGLEMLGGNYTLMTKNLPAEHVAGVEVLNNHNEARMDKGKVSDQVALNVRLKNSALLRPIGTSEVAIGCSENRVLYTLGTTGMTFSKKLQATVSVKTGNIENFAENQMEIRYGLGNRGGKSNAENAVGELRGSRPSLEQRRYLNVDDRLVTANSISKLSEYNTLRVNSSYAYHKERNEAATASQYFLGDGNWLSLEQISEALARRHEPRLTVRFNHNADSSYLNNETYFSGRFIENELPTFEISQSAGSDVAQQTAIAQRQKIDYLNLGNSLSYRVKIGRREWSAGTEVAWTKAPTSRLNISSEHAPYNAAQTAASETFSARQRLSTSIDVGRSSIYFPINLSFRHDILDTELLRHGAATARNDLKGNSGELSLQPSYRYTSVDKRFDLQTNLDLRGVMMNGENYFGNMENLSRPEKINFYHIFLDPSFYFTYTASATTRWTLNASYRHSQGDLLTLLTQPVMRNYRNVSARSGILAQNAAFSSRAGYNYKNPLSMWFVSLSADYSNTKQNLFSSSYITENTSSSTALRGDNHTQSVGSHFEISKGLQDINSKFSAFGSWSWSERSMIQQDIPMTYYGTNLTGGVSANLRPWRWMEAELSATLNLYGSRYTSVRDSYREFDSSASLSFFPIPNLTLRAGGSFSHYQLPDSRYKDIALFDASATYKYRQLRFRLSANNLFDQRHYSYSVYSGLDTHSYDYTLRPREIIFSVIFTK